MGSFAGAGDRAPAPGLRGAFDLSGDERRLRMAALQPGGVRVRQCEVGIARPQVGGAHCRLQFLKCSVLEILSIRHGRSPALNRQRRVALLEP